MASGKLKKMYRYILHKGIPGIPNYIFLIQFSFFKCQRFFNFLLRCIATRGSIHYIHYQLCIQGDSPSIFPLIIKSNLTYRKKD